MKFSGIAEKVVEWALEDRSTIALVLIGSRARVALNVGVANLDSDWDFQLITKEPLRFCDGDGMNVLRGVVGARYIYRPARLGHVAKGTIISEEGCVDLVIIPHRRILLLRMLWSCGLYKMSGSALGASESLAAVLKGGYLFIKGGKAWGRFFKRLQEMERLTALNEQRICALADCFYVDYIATCNKIRNGELLAAQRWLHCNLAEINFRLLQEINQRAGLPSFPDARRIEAYCESALLGAVTVCARPTVAELNDAVAQCAAAHRMLIHRLIGERWRWPDTPITVAPRIAPR